MQRFTNYVCPFVCPSNAGTVSKWTLFFDISGRGTIVVFFNQQLLQNSKGKALTGSIKYKEVDRFHKYCHLSQKWYETGL